MFNEEYTIKVLIIMVLMVVGMSYFMKKITTSNKKDEE